MSRGIARDGFSGRTGRGGRAQLVVPVGSGERSLADSICPPPSSSRGGALAGSIFSTRPGCQVTERQRDATGTSEGCLIAETLFRPTAVNQSEEIEPPRHQGTRKQRAFSRFQRPEPKANHAALTDPVSLPLPAAPFLGGLVTWWRRAFRIKFKGAEVGRNHPLPRRGGISMVRRSRDAW